jgi:glucose-6-phosphate 1-epimerase
MMNIDELDDQFCIEGELGFAELENDQIFITISNKHADADICLYGAHVTSFKPRNTLDILWLSPESEFEVGKPIRGGIPVCFPWFGVNKTDSSLPPHGFARLMYWEVLQTATKPTGETEVVLQLCSSDETRSYWPHDFCLQMNIVVGKVLKINMVVTNTSNQIFNYSGALHSYFSLSAIENLSIKGLQGAEYLDLVSSEHKNQEEEYLQIQEETDFHFLNTEADVIIDDSIFRRRIKIAKSGSKVTTVWNPWIEKCARISGLPDNAYETFVCVETVNAFDDTIKLAPGESHTTTAIIGLDN